MEANTKRTRNQVKTGFLWEKKLRVAKGCVVVFFISLLSLFDLLIKPYACVALIKIFL